MLGGTGTTGAGRRKAREVSEPQFIKLHLHTRGAEESLCLAQSEVPA